MLRYFDRLDLKILDKPTSQTNNLQTHVATRLHYKHQGDDGGGSSDGYGFVWCNEDFEKYYNSIKKTLDHESSIATKFSYLICIQGRINGIPVEKNFDDLDSFHHFLKENELVNVISEKAHSFKPK